jgi:hypothetical protein
MSGVGDVVCVKQKPPNNSALTGFLDHLSLYLVRKSPPPSLNLKRKPLVRPNNMNSFTHIQDTYTQYFLIFLNLRHLAKTNPGCLIQQTD